MGVGAAGDDRQPALEQLLGQDLGVFHHLRGIDLERGVERLAERHRLGGDDMHQGATLNAGENRRVDLFRDVFTVGQDHAAARAAQGLVGSGGHDIGKGEGRGMRPARHQPGKMRHIDHQIRAHLIGNRAEAGKVDLARNGRAAGNDQLGVMFQRQRLDLIVVDQVVLRPHPVLHRMKPLARLVRGRPMRQVPARGQIHPQNGVTRLDQRVEHALIGLAAGIGLHIGIGAAKQGFRAADRQIFRHIDPFAATVIAPPGIALGVFVGHHRALRLHHGAADDVFRGDQLDLAALAAKLAGDCREQLGVAVGQGFGEKAGVTVRGGHGASPVQGGGCEFL